MQHWIKLCLIIVGVVALACIIASSVGALLWRRDTHRNVMALEQERHIGTDTSAPHTFSRDELAGLPNPVIRYFEFALTAGQPLIRRARLRQTGDFAMRPGSWSRFTATEYVSVYPVGFIWDARIRVMPLLNAYVHDGYIAGEGRMYGKVAAVVPVVNEGGTSEMASGELMRYLCEAAWFPTALLPSAGVSWRGVDDSTAVATLADGSTSVSVDVHFGENGEILRTEAMRYRMVDESSVLTAWIGHFSEYKRSGNMMTPSKATVEWVLHGKPSPYWRGEIVHADYDFVATVRSPSQ